MKRVIEILIIVFFLINIVNANIISVDVYGGGDYITIHEAVSNASDGDSILVMSGQYDFTESLGVLTIDKELFIIGSGYDKVEDGGTKITDITGNGLFILDGSSDGTHISGFRMYSAGTCITLQSNAKNIIVEKNYFMSDNWVLSLNECQNDTIRSNILVSKFGVICNGTTNDAIVNNLLIGIGAGRLTQSKGVQATSVTSLLISNNVFLKLGDSYAAYYSGAVTIKSGTTDIYSNVFLDCFMGIYDNGTSYITNNCFFGNENDGQIGQNPVEADPTFVNFSSGSSYEITSFDDDEYDFHLETNSPCINTGRVGPAFNDVDGTLNDIGMYGGPWPYMNDLGIPTIPEVISISVTPGSVSPNGTITIKATGRIGSGQSSGKAVSTNAINRNQ